MQLSNCPVAKHTWRVTRLDERGVPALGAMFLGGLTIALWFGMSYGLAAADAFFRGTVLADGLARVQQSLSLSTLVQFMAMGMVLAVGLRWFQPELTPADALSLAPVRLRLLTMCVVLGLCLQFPLTELANVLHHRVFGPDPLEHQLAVQRLLEAHSGLEGMVVVTCLVAIVPLTEELLFRGLFYFGLSRRYGHGIGLIGSAVLFGLAHVNAVAIVYATVAGLVLGQVAARTRSVWPGVALHAGVNGLPLLLPESLIPIRGFNVPTEAPSHLEAWLVWPPLALACLAFYGVFALSRGATDD
jgi:membrane protease YdiL (CAAX protease family)